MILVTVKNLYTIMYCLSYNSRAFHTHTPTNQTHPLAHTPNITINLLQTPMSDFRPMIQRFPYINSDVQYTSSFIFWYSLINWSRRQTLYPGLSVHIAVYQLYTYLVLHRNNFYVVKLDKITAFLVTKSVQCYLFTILF